MGRDKLLYASGSGYPTPDTGGGNKIIHSLIKNISHSKFEVSYFSYDINKVYKTVQEIDLDQSTFLPRLRILGRRLANHSIFTNTSPQICRI